MTHKYSYLFANEYGMIPIAVSGEVEETTQNTDIEFSSMGGQRSITKRRGTRLRTWGCESQIAQHQYGPLSELASGAMGIGPFRLLTKHAAMFNALPDSFWGEGNVTVVVRDANGIGYNETQGAVVMTDWTPIPPDAEDIVISAWVRGSGKLGIRYVNSLDGTYSDQSFPYSVDPLVPERVWFRVTRSLEWPYDGVQIRSSNSGALLKQGRPCLTFTSEPTFYNTPLGCSSVIFAIETQKMGAIPNERDWTMMDCSIRIREIG